MTTRPDTVPAAKPILLTRLDVRALLAGSDTEIRRPIRPGPVALQTTYRPGDRLWVREAFSTRRDGDRIKLRYPADGPQGQPQYVRLDEGNRRFGTQGYRTWPAKFMPLWASRLLLQVADARVEHHGDRREVVLTVRVKS